MDRDLVETVSNSVDLAYQLGLDAGYQKGSMVVLTKMQQALNVILDEVNTKQFLDSLPKAENVKS